MTLRPIDAKGALAKVSKKRVKKSSGFSIKNKPEQSSVRPSIASSEPEEVVAEIELNSKERAQVKELDELIERVVGLGSLAKRIYNTDKRSRAAGQKYMTAHMQGQDQDQEQEQAQDKENNQEQSAAKENPKSKRILLGVQSLWDEIRASGESSMDELTVLAAAASSRCRKLADRKAHLTLNVFDELALVLGSIRGLSATGDSVKVGNLVVVLPPTHETVSRRLVFLLLCISSLRFCRRVFRVYGLDIEDQWPVAKITRAKITSNKITSGR